MTFAVFLVILALASSGCDAQGVPQGPDGGPYMLMLESGRSSCPGPEYAGFSNRTCGAAGNPSLRTEKAGPMWRSFELIPAGQDANGNFLVTFATFGFPGMKPVKCAGQLSVSGTTACADRRVIMDPSTGNPGGVWALIPVANDLQGTYNVVSQDRPNGCSSVYLSAPASCSSTALTLASSDTGSGRQRWVLQGNNGPQVVPSPPPTVVTPVSPPPVVVPSPSSSPSPSSPPPMYSPPSQPSGVVATAIPNSATTATVTWMAPVSNGGMDITSYQVTCLSVYGSVVGPQSFPPFSLSTGAGGFVGLEPNFPYTCTVTATNAWGMVSSPSPPSNMFFGAVNEETQTQTSPPPPPPQPMGFMVPADNVCGWFAQREDQCRDLGLIEYVITLGGNALSCPSPPTQANVPAGPLNQLNDFRPLPKHFDNVKGVYKAEGSSYYWLFRMVRNFAGWVQCVGNSPNELFLPAGFVQKQVLYLPQGVAYYTLPIAVAIHEPISDHYVILVRGTLTQYEWALDFQYNQNDATTFDFPAPVHKGFGLIFDTIWGNPGDNLLADMINNIKATATSKTRVTVSGHSLGAGVSQLLGYAVASTLAGSAVKPVETVLFAPPNVGGPEFVSAFNKIVNGRRIAYTDDSIPQFPCSPTQKACKPLAPNVFPLPIDTTEDDTVAKWEFQAVGGDLPITAEIMPRDSATWAKIAYIPLQDPTAYLTATHTCAYLCFTSQFAQGTVATDACWLSEKPSSVVGSQCGAFPVANYP